MSSKEKAHPPGGTRGGYRAARGLGFGRLVRLETMES